MSSGLIRGLTCAALKKELRLVWSPFVFWDFGGVLWFRTNNLSTFVSPSTTDCTDLQGHRLWGNAGWFLGVFSEAVICERCIYLEVGGGRWREPTLWLRSCPSLPLQIYDWEDLCPVQHILLIDSLVDFPPGGWLAPPLCAAHIPVFTL